MIRQGMAGRRRPRASSRKALAELVLLARRHKLDMLVHLLEMAQLEAEERVRLRSQRKLS